MKRLKNIDPFTTAVPFAAIFLLCIFFILDPTGSSEALGAIRHFLGDELGVYYLIVGLGVFLISLYMAFSRYGNIVLGAPADKPKYGFFAWGSMMFTAGLAADILFYSLCEWMLYADEPRISELGSVQDWASTMPLFHWGPIPWSFYAALAACFGFMLHVRKRSKQKYSEACRPILGKYTDLAPGKCIDVLAVAALIAGTATTFSVATPLLSRAICRLIGVSDSVLLTISILLIICAVYTYCVLRGMKSINFLARLCMYIFYAFVGILLLCGGETRYIIETGFTAMGNLAQHFIGLCTWTDALRSSSFPQNWTIFYWAYWMVWCVASPFFMGSISKGRTVRQVVLGAYAFGMGSTFISFIILGNYSLGLQMRGILDVMGIYAANGNLYDTIIAVVETMPFFKLMLVLLIFSMICFYATSFDSITLVASNYSYREFHEGEKASKGMNLFWALLLIMLPIALLFSESSMSNLQTVSIIAAFPIALVILLIIASFFKDADDYMKEG